MRVRVRAHLVPCVALGVSIFGSGCVAEPEEQEAVGVSEQAATSPDATSFPATYARQWMTNFSNSVKGDMHHPVVAARTFTYGAVAIYEAVVNGMPGYRSLGGQLNGLGEMPTPVPGVTYDWPTVLAQTMHRVASETYVFPLRVFFEFTTLTEVSLASLGPAQIAFRLAEGVSATTSAASVAFGDELADVLVEWINSDGYAEARFKGWIPPEGPDKWVPTGFADVDKVRPPDQPGFATMVRPLVMTDPSECAPEAPPEFSTDPSSEFYQAALEVYDVEVNLSDEEREIARFWDDYPGDTPTPTGHWLALTTKYVRGGTLAEAAYGYAQASLTHHDAAIAIWNEKYRSNLIRPETYIRRHIDPHWRPFLRTPYFPTYVSGHSGFSGAAAEMMKVAFGDGPVVNDTKLRRGFAPRTFPNWEAVAVEASTSRLYGGIHYTFDNVVGLEVGQCVAEKAIARVQFTE